MVGTEGMSAWGWPQWGILVSTCIAVVVHICLHDRPLPDPNYNGIRQFIYGAVGLFILWCGGFFG